MKISYEKGILTVNCSDEEIKTVDYIFSRSDGIELVRYHLNSLFEQRKAQKDSEEREAVIALLKPEEIQEILKRKEA